MSKNDPVTGIPFAVHRPGHRVRFKEQVIRRIARCMDTELILFLVRIDHQCAQLITRKVRDTAAAGIFHIGPCEKRRMRADAPVEHQFKIPEAQLAFGEMLRHG